MPRARKTAERHHAPRRGCPCYWCTEDFAPTPDEIAAACAAFQAGWTARERTARIAD